MADYFDKYEIFYGCQYHNESLYNFSKVLEDCINETASPFSKDIDSQLNYIKKRTTYEQLTDIVKDKYVVFYHDSKDCVSDKHKFIIRLKNCHFGGNGAMGAIRFQFDIIKSNYVFPSYYSDKSIEDALTRFDDNFDEHYIDGRKLFHYTTYYFSRRFFQGSKIFNTLKQAEKYYNSIHSWWGKDVLV